jgi:hypothetical protein
MDIFLYFNCVGLFCILILVGGQKTFSHDYDYFFLWKLLPVLLIIFSISIGIFAITRQNFNSLIIALILSGYLGYRIRSGEVKNKYK